jgi:hypothetical protein
MKTFKYWMVIPTALAMILTSVGVARAQTIQLTPEFKPDPLVVTGTSGGSQTNKGCGMMGAAPNHVITLTIPSITCASVSKAIISRLF